MAYIEDTNLIEEVKSLRVVVGGKDVFPDEAKRSVLRVIQEQPTADVVEVKWIDVNERLPDENGRYLINYIHSYCRDDGFQAIETAYFADGKFVGILGFYLITHWMPLPEPPKMNDKE